MAEAEFRLTGLKQGVQGRLRVGAIPTILPYWLAPRIGGFLERFPEVDLHLTEDTTQRLIEALRRDFAARGVPAADLLFDSFDYAPDTLERQRTSAVTKS